MVRFEKATPADAQTLMQVQVRAFLSQIPADKRQIIVGPPSDDCVPLLLITPLIAPACDTGRNEDTGSCERVGRQGEAR